MGLTGQNKAKSFICFQRIFATVDFYKMCSTIIQHSFGNSEQNLSTICQLQETSLLKDMELR